MTQLSNEQGMVMILGMCAAVMAIVFFRRKMEILVRFLLRALCGVVCIYVVNYVMLRLHYPGTLGWNPVTVLTTGFLGLPGLIALYGIKIVSLL